jgi:hypothetical protein
MTALSAIALRLLLTYWKQLLAGLGVVLALWAVYSAVYGRGYDKANAEWEARQQAAQAQAQADSWAYIDTLHGIDVTLTADKAQTQQLRTIYRDRIRTVAVDVYRDRQCDLPRGVFDDLNAIRAGTALPVVGGNDGALPTAPALDGSDHPNAGHSRR